MKLTTAIIFPSKVLEFLLTIGLNLWQILCLFFLVWRTCIPPVCCTTCSCYFSVWVLCWPRVSCRLKGVPCRIISGWKRSLTIIWAVFNMSAIICVIILIIYPNTSTINTRSTDAFAIKGVSLKIDERKIIHEWHMSHMIWLTKLGIARYRIESTCFKYSERFSTKDRISRIQCWVTIESITRTSIRTIVHTWAILKSHINQLKSKESKN